MKKEMKVYIYYYKTFYNSLIFNFFIEFEEIDKRIQVMIEIRSSERSYVRHLSFVVEVICCSFFEIEYLIYFKLLEIFKFF